MAFDERLAGYGHEDTLFGYQLGRAGIPVLHIDNPVLHGQLETNARYLQKSREAIRNLVRIRNFLNDRGFAQHVKLLATYERLQQKNLFPLIRFLVKLLQPAARYLLANGIIDLRWFDLYRMGCLMKELQAEESKQP